VSGPGNSAAVHEVMVTVPLGVVPRELERFHPVAGYDLAVTGDWSRDEVAILHDDLRAYLERNRYERVIVQIQGGRHVVVYPRERATAPAVHPGR